MDSQNFLIINGYSKNSREGLRQAGMTCAAQMHVNMVRESVPDADCEVFFVADDNTKILMPDEIEKYDGIIWTGCDKSLTNKSDEDLKSQLATAENILKTSVPCWGTCWGLQVMAVAAGGKVEKNSNPREIGPARKITLTDEGALHEMYSGKKKVFDVLASHSDVVTEIPAGAVVLAKNNNSAVQAMAFEYNDTFFWGTQYHPDYTLYEVSRLMIARRKNLISEGFFGRIEQFSHLDTGYREALVYS